VKSGSSRGEYARHFLVAARHARANELGRSTVTAPRFLLFTWDRTRAVAEDALFLVDVAPHAAWPLILTFLEERVHDDGTLVVV